MAETNLTVLLPESMNDLVKSLQGAPGKDGVDGIVGRDGKDGLPGKDGVDGRPGRDGTNGVDGGLGLKGDKGDTGAQGPQGPQGVQGVKGDTGATGAVGAAGPAGLRGATGPAGPAGTGGGGTGGWVRPTTQAQLQQLMTDAFANNYVAYLDPRTELEISTTLTMFPKDSGGNPNGIIGNGAKLQGVMNDGTGVVRLQGTANAQGWSNSRAVEFSGFSISGGRYIGKNTGPCLSIICPKAGEIRGGLFEKLRLTSSNTDGLYLQGDFYESWFHYLSVERSAGNGVKIVNADGVISNLNFRDMNLSHNDGYAIDSESNHLHLDGGSFINNGAGGILARAGLWQANALQFENSGLIAIDMPWIQYRSRITNCEASSDGAFTYANGKPMQYLLKCPTTYNAKLHFPGDPLNSVIMYGTNGLVMALRAP